MRGTRWTALDQFRGYIVVGMLLANFSGQFGLGERVFGHGDGFFNWADSIMPGFLFCAGISFRMTAMRRFPQWGPRVAAWGYVRRSLVLVGLSLALYGIQVAVERGRPWAGKPVSEILHELWKADLWEVLSIIGVSQLLLLPVICRSAWVRLAAAVGLFIGYIALNGMFVYNFQQGLDNWLNQYVGAHQRRSWDGGVFGVLAWAVPMTAGSLVAEALTAESLTGERAVKATQGMLRAGAALLIAGYALSCLTTLYDRVPAAAGVAVSANRHAADPVWPRADRWRSPGLRLAEPPFIPPAPVADRELNFWMMSKRIVSPSFNLFALGFNLVLFCAFICVCDHGGRESSLFRLFGQNPLAAYFLHLALLHVLYAVVPGFLQTGPAALILFAAYFALCWWMLRLLEARRWYLRL